MTAPAPDSLRPFYADWAGYNRRVLEGIRRFSPEDLTLRAPGSDHWPIWAIVGHMGRARIFWLCDVFGEPGAQLTPFAEPGNTGWEDAARPATAGGLADAYASTWSVVEGCLERWKPSGIGEQVRRDEEGWPPEFHTRQSILLRLINHEAYHVGEMNLALGAAGREPIDLWPGDEWREGVPVQVREG